MSENIIITIITAGFASLPVTVSMLLSAANNKLLKRENKQLKSRILELENKNKDLKNRIIEFEKRTELTLKNGIYYDINDNAFCPKCYANGKRMVLDTINHDGDIWYICKSCRYNKPMD